MKYALLALLVLVACHPRTDDERNKEPFAKYTDALVGKSGAKVSPRACAMFSGSRKGYCVVEGTGEENARFANGLGLVDAPEWKGHTSDFQSCTRVDPKYSAPDVHIVKAGTAALPPNTDNVKLVVVYVAKDAMCIEYQYPYG
jgi:hypothetical protein